MGTHPIFESDFDCLTESKMLSRVAQTALRRSVPMVAPISRVQVRHSGAVPTMSLSQLEAAWVEYFDSDACDYWYLRRGLRELLQDDLVPSPEVSQAVLYCCRRNNNLPAAIRFLELVKFKCGPHEEAYDYVMQELAPTMADLGLKSPEELGLDVVVTDLE